MIYQRKHNYEYREGWRPSVDANTVGGVIEEIESQHGTVTSELFLEASRAEDSPTHDVFEWDDSAAAEKYRLHQASRTICAIRVVIQDAENAGTNEGKNRARDEPLPRLPRAFINIVSDDSKKARYMNVRDALSDEETRAAVLMRAVRELRAFQEKYERLQELAEVFSAINKLRTENN